VNSLQCQSIFPNLVHIWAQKVDYLKHYITYKVKILEGLYLWFFGSDIFFVKIGAIIKKLISPYQSSSEMWYNILLLLIYIWDFWFYNFYPYAPGLLRRPLDVWGPLSVGVSVEVEYWLGLTWKRHPIHSTNFCMTTQLLLHKFIGELPTLGFV